VSTRLAQDLPAVRGDRVQLQQLLLNLIVNATDAMAEVPDGDRVVTIVTTREESAVLLSVSDTGPGVPRDAVGKLFEPFWSTRPDGRGMGLAVCRSIAEAHSGSLELENPGSAGACFSLRLPLPAALR
jgi:C4-dicarboxylate-specific signal transduction histidine kinase